MDFMQILQQYWYVLVFFGVIIIGSFVFNTINKNRVKAANQNFLAEHPDAAKVYLVARAMVTSEAVQVYTVNGEPPQKFFEGTKTGFYLLPGKSTAQVSYTYTRPGVMYKNVTKSTGAVTKELEVDAYKSYILGFDRKAEAFTFEETESV